MAESYGKKYTRDVQLKVLGTTEQATASIVIKECGLPITVNEFLEDFHKRQKSSLSNANLMEGMMILLPSKKISQIAEKVRCKEMITLITGLNILL